MMSMFFILSNLVLPRMALKVFISVILKSCFVSVVAALVAALQAIIGLSGVKGLQTGT